MHTSKSNAPPATGFGIPTCLPAHLPTCPSPSASTSLPNCHTNSGGSMASVMGMPTLLSKLTSVTAQLPESVPVAKPEDAVAALCGNIEVILFSLEDDEPYEWLDHKLNNICGSWAVNQGLVPLAIKHGDLSLPGLCSTLQFFINRKLASEVLIETQLRILLNEVERM